MSMHSHLIYTYRYTLFLLWSKYRTWMFGTQVSSACNERLSPNSVVYFTRQLSNVQNPFGEERDFPVLDPSSP